ncbi:anaerobic ribonucleoside-triphosphate reductase activating protein [Hippea maritima]|uniref:Anaerobic ribonucleoside-triphosphate reductase activating protein n=1 Tax=Hippea maritima (strain ATCC 700847 / DSM 10411 / MH2) TaxID=760142 RepID=F2LWK1_HIPMA|nr:anaerobic ribonucleoside-triphosphate reductase activating protein [Hippea maritima]AEA34110.1 anaerobic ribonucleoside-triphosphate reductase activating protein [Hippea maritima DSM 10411]
MFGGLLRFSLIDYPGELAAVVFTLGCNFRCPYCHNPELIDGTSARIDEGEILSFLEKRKGKLTAVSITGGEPTLHKDRLFKFIQKLKKLGYKVKLDTNGTNPEIISKLLNSNLLDYIAMDVKAPLEKYSDVVDVKVNIEAIKTSINTIKNSQIAYEFRTTVVRDIITQQDIDEISKIIQGSNLFCIQNFIPSKTLNPLFKEKSGYSNKELEEMKKNAQKWVKNCILR